MGLDDGSQEVFYGINPSVTWRKLRTATDGRTLQPVGTNGGGLPWPGCSGFPCPLQAIQNGFLVLAAVAVKSEVPWIVTPDVSDFHELCRVW